MQAPERVRCWDHCKRRIRIWSANLCGPTLTQRLWPMMSSLASSTQQPENGETVITDLQCSISTKGLMTNYKTPPCRPFLQYHAGTGQYQPQWAKMDRFGWRHRSNVDRVTQHCHGWQQGVNNVCKCVNSASDVFFFTTPADTNKDVADSSARLCKIFIILWMRIRTMCATFKFWI